MKQAVRKHIKELISNLHLLEIPSIQNDADFQDLLSNAELPVDKTLAAFAYLKYVVESPDHKPLINSDAPLFRYFLINNHIDFLLFKPAATIVSIAQLWNAPTMKAAKKDAEQVLKYTLQAMSDSDIASIRDTPSVFDSLKWDSIYKLLFQTALLLSCQLLGKDAFIIIDRDSKMLIPSFAYEAASFLWKKDMYAPAAVLFKSSIDSRKLEIESLLDAYNCWGLCEIEQNNTTTARKIYEQAMAQHGDNRSRNMAYIYANMAYLLGKLADQSEKDSDAQQHRKKALEYIEKSIDIDGGKHNTLYTKATLHYDCNELDEACSFYKKAFYCAHGHTDELSALRTLLEIRLEQLLGGPCNSDISPKSIEDCFRLYLERKELYPIDSEDYNTIENMWLNYSIGKTLQNPKLGICLLKIYFHAKTLKNSLQYSVPPFNASEKCTNTITTQPVIAYYTPLGNAKFLLEKSKSEQEVDETEENWPDAHKPFTKAQNRLTMMHVCYMNDPNEGHTLIQALENELDKSTKKNQLFKGSSPDIFRRKLLDEKFVFLKSFTSLVDQLNMWSTYASDRSTGSDSNGCCICIAPQTFQMMQNAPLPKAESSHTIAKDRDDYNLYRVAYLSEGVLIVPDVSKTQRKAIQKNYNQLIKLFKELNRLIGTNPTPEALTKIWRGLSISLSFIAFLFKDAAYEAEKELRLIVTRSKSNRGEIQHTDTTPSKLFIMPPHQIFVEKIILGPKVSAPDTWIPHLQYQLAEMWESWPESYKNPPIPKVRKSSISYRD